MSDQTHDIAALAADVDGAMSGLQLADDTTLFYTLEAIHEMSHVLGGLFHEEVSDALTHIESIDDNPGDLREYVAQFVAEQRHRFEPWLTEHGLPWINWWTHHASGVMLRWSMEAK